MKLAIQFQTVLPKTNFGKHPGSTSTDQMRSLRLGRSRAHWLVTVRAGLDPGFPDFTPLCPQLIPVFTCCRHLYCQKLSCPRGLFCSGNSPRLGEQGFSLHLCTCSSTAPSLLPPPPPNLSQNFALLLCLFPRAKNHRCGNLFGKGFHLDESYPGLNN